MAVSKEYLHFIIDQLSNFGAIKVKHMFGGVGLFHEGLMFGKISKDVLFLKVDNSNQKDFEERKMKPFFSKKKKKGMPYWEVPQNIIDDKILLAEWSKKSFEAAVKAKQ